MLWFHGLLVGKTWHPPTTVRDPEPAVGLVEVARGAGFALGRGVARVVVTIFADADAMGGPGRCGSAPARVPPAGVGTACPEGPVQAVTTTSEHTSAVLSLRLGVSARSQITAVACPPRKHGS